MSCVACVIDFGAGSKVFVAQMCVVSVSTCNLYRGKLDAVAAVGRADNGSECEFFVLTGIYGTRIYVESQYEFVVNAAHFDVVDFEESFLVAKTFIGITAESSTLHAVSNSLYVFRAFIVKMCKRS